MTILSVLILLLIAGLCGAIGQMIVGYSRGGFLASIVIGFIGAFLGMWFSRQMGLPEAFAIEVDGRTFPILWSIVGSSIFVALLSLLTGSYMGRTYYRY